MPHFKIYIYIACIAFTIIGKAQSSEFISQSIVALDDHTQEISLTFIIPENDYVYKDFITLSCYEPTVSISPWKANKLPIPHYDPFFKNTKMVFNQNFTITTIATATHSIPTTVYLYCSYYRQSEKKINQLLLPIQFTNDNTTTESTECATHDATKTNLLIAANTVNLSPLEYSYQTILMITQSTTETIKVNHKKYMIFIITVISVLLLLLHVLKKLFPTYIMLKELFNCILLLLGTVIITCITFYLTTLFSPLISTLLICFNSLATGLFFIKESTNIHTRYLCSFYNIIGILCICNVTFLLFKMLRYF